jgi:hypothetical protein
MIITSLFNYSNLESFSNYLSFSTSSALIALNMSLAAPKLKLSPVMKG